MKLAIIRQRFTPFGGAERFIERALSALSPEGLDITIISRDWPEGAQTSYRRRLVKPFSVGRTWRDAAFARAACREVEAGRFDLVQSHERLACCDIYRAGDGVHREWLEQRARIRSSGATLLDRISPFHRRLLRAELAMFSGSRLKHVICISRMVREDIQRHYDVPDSKLNVIYNGIDLDAFNPCLRDLHRDRLRAQLELPNAAVVFLFVGSGFERKGLPLLLRLWSSLPETAHLVVVGHDKRSRQYQEMARERGVENRVRFVGPQRDMPQWYGLADVFAFPSLYEPFGNAPLEALASGVPVLTTPKCGAGELLHPGVDGEIIDGCDPKRWRQALLGWLPATRHSTARPHARASAEPYTFALMEQNYRQLYSRLTPPTP